jgi:hypothetical protein
MRRISLTLALVAAVATTGCGDDSDGATPIVPDPITFTLTIENGLPRKADGSLTNAALAIAGGKVVSAAPASSIDCGEGGDDSKCVVSLPQGTTVVLAAQPVAPKVFVNWGGACSGAGSCTLTLDSDKYVVATFGDAVVSSNHHVWAAGTFASAYAVTAECVKCHAMQAAQVMETLHWTWKGATPQLYSFADFVADPLAAQNPGTIGKENLVNNFCVAVPSNEKRCDQCHAGYGGDPDPTKPQKSARAYTAADSSIPLSNRVDCLICHSNLTASGYTKAPASFGLPPATADLAAAASSIVRTPARENCGFCHFYAGGGDNVKLMGSALKSPTPELDAHMGNGMTCSQCHAEPGHEFKGAGIHVPANTGRSSCEDCHGAAPHAALTTVGPLIDRHTDAIACQTCHIPTFSRGQFAKMDWDWSTAGDKTKGTAGVVKTAVNDLGAPDASGTVVTTYDYIKGDFLWQRNVKPAYAWYNGKMVHATTMDRGAFSSETGLTTADADRITLGAPLGSGEDATAKIFPFKLMRGRQAVYVDDATRSSFVITPNVFGPAGFWGVIQSAGYAYDPASRSYTAPAAATPVTTATPIDSLWSAAFTKGAIAAGQLAAGTPTMAKLDGANPGWDWRYTKLYMDLNHEVAPKAQALSCGACHSATPVIDWTQLGYCPDPMFCAKRP